ncbi:MFS transporter [Streptomyces sp. H27-H1]|uniref:MFS transporter n=1 Tax=Streptomyces sp. H27-H1 TaxID=2996461 RepID=UPI00226EAA91|nr:MFS transporter [Streptomyces sp. H27-H1]MCY0931110.1 MFS transporter [Streptomyces sp. H27-H1]
MSTWRRTSVTGRVLLLTVLLTGLTTFMFLPLLAVRLAAQGLPTGQVGLLVGLLSASTQGFSLVSGAVVDRIRPRTVLGAGFTLRIAGYLLLAFGLTGSAVLPALLAGIVSVGIGGSLIGLSIKTRLVREAGEAPREMLALRSTFVNVGVVAGPALGAAIYPLGFGWILAACITSHLLLGLYLTARDGQAVQVAAARAAGTSAAAPAEPGRSLRHWLPLLLIGTAYWALYNQLNVVLPITAQRLTGSTAAITLVFTVNGVLCVLFQYSLLRHVFGRASSRTLLVLGFLSFAAAYLVFVPLGGWAALLVFILPVTLAEMLISPSLDEQAVKAVSARRTGLALGAISGAGALGSLLGAWGGGLLLQTLGEGSGTWIVVSSVAALAAATALLLPKGSKTMPETMPTAVLLSPRDKMIAAAESLGLAVVVVDDPTQPRPPATGWPVIETVWTTSRDELVARLREFAFTGPVVCFGFGELGSGISAEVNQELGWPGNPPEALAAFKNKARLRALVGDRAGKPVAHVLGRTTAELAAGIERIGLPCVVKPVDGSGSAGVRLLTDGQDASRFLREAEGAGPHLVEEYLIGAEFSVEAVSVAGRHRILAVTEKQTTGAPQFVETGHTLPVRLPSEDAAAVAALVQATLDATGYRFGPSHTELMLTADGPRLIESHGRAGGDRISDMQQLALGEDVYALTMAALFGLPLPAGREHPRVAGIRYVTFDGTLPMPETSTELVASLPGVTEVHITVPAGRLPAPILKSGDRHGFVLAVADTRDELEARLECAVRTLTADAVATRS